ncbi:MAG: squalene synthase HpnC, partial [bacterium]
MKSDVGSPVDVVAGIVEREGRILICRRPAGGEMSGFWEFPGGKIETDETPEEALSREIREELEVEVEVGSMRWETLHRYEELTVHLRFYDCRWRSGEAKNLGVDGHEWILPSRLGEFEFLPADAPLLDSLREGGDSLREGGTPGEGDAPPESVSPREGEKASPADIEAAYRACAEIAAARYENFPVASRLLPARMRPHMAAVYAFARGADDIADEPGEEGEEDPRARLAEWERKLEAAGEGRGEGPAFTALAETIRLFSLPLQPFRDLIAAFRQDLDVHRYPDFPALLGYCRLSANPVGRIVLMLHGAPGEEDLKASDAICTALQLANHLQDVRKDFERGRVYLPQEDLEGFGVSEDELRGEGGSGEMSSAFRALMVHEVRRVRALFAEGLPLLRRTRGALGRELRAIWRGGVAALEGIERAGYDVLRAPPRLGKGDRLRCLFAAAAPVSRLERLAGRGAGERADRDYCRWVVRRSRSNFHLAFLTLPRDRRRALSAVYAFCRVVDDIADSPGEEAEKRRRLGRWKEAVGRLEGRELPHPILRELAWTASVFGLPARRLREVCEGVEMDIGRRRFETFEDLKL